MGANVSEKMDSAGVGGGDRGWGGGSRAAKAKREIWARGESRLCHRP